MLRLCQHRLAFTKTSWYTFALKSLIPTATEIKRTVPGKYQYRSTTSVASSLETSDDMQTTFVAPSLLPPIEPLQTGHAIYKSEVEKLVMLEKYRRCSAYRSYDGHRCERLVKTDPSSPITDQVVCFNHNSSKTLKKSKKKVLNKAAELRSSENRASEETIDALIRQYSPSILGKRKIVPPQRLYNCWDCKYCNYPSFIS